MSDSLRTRLLSIAARAENREHIKRRMLIAERNFCEYTLGCTEVSVKKSHNGFPYNAVLFALMVGPIVSVILGGIP